MYKKMRPLCQDPKKFYQTEGWKRTTLLKGVEATGNDLCPNDLADMLYMPF